MTPITSLREEAEPSGETVRQREEVCAAWAALPDNLRRRRDMRRLYLALGGPRMDDPAEAGGPGTLEDGNG